MVYLHPIAVEAENILINWIGIQSSKIGITNPDWLIGDIKLGYRSNNTAPTELNTPIMQSFYYDIDPTEPTIVLKNRIDQLVLQLYDLTEEEIN